MSKSKHTNSELPPHAVCTLFEGVYGRGAVVLVNSLIASGFEGHLYLGYRRELLNCVSKMVDRLNEDETFRVQPHLIQLDTDRHFAMHKPRFMLDMREELEKKAEVVWYFDPDIVVNKPWVDFVEWAKYGVSLCENEISPLPSHHFKRRKWKEFAREWDITWRKDRDIYFNSGFIGVPRECTGVLQAWKNVVGKMEAHGFGHGAEHEGVKLTESGPRTVHPFNSIDQDALNFATSCYGGSICPVPKRGMGFADGGMWMGHATGSAKPWNARYIYRALSGKGIRKVDSLYWKHATSPFMAHSMRKVLMSKIRYNIARVIHRIF